MSAPFIPELSLGTVETGGGWGVGEQFARLPPASVQAESRVPVYTIGPDRGENDHNESDSDSSSSSDGDGDSSTQEPSPLVLRKLAKSVAMEKVPTTHYTSQSAEDDDTFVDHGSTAPPASPPTDVLTTTCGNITKENPCQTPALHLKFSRPVSRMIVQQGVRAMVVAPNGGSLWVAVGDDPITMMDFKGVELNISRTVDVTHVYAMTVVRIPAAKSVTFKTPPRAAHRGKHNPAPRLGQSCDDDGEDTYALWCGVTRGSIVIVNLDDYTGGGVIRGAHAQTISGLWHLGNGKVWTAGYDKALKVWDPQTRRRTKSRNIAAIITDLCYVRSCKQVWAISDDTLIRVFDAAGNNVRVAKQSPDKPESALRMKSEMRSIAYYEPADLIYVAFTRSLAAIVPATCEIAVNINVTLTSMTFLENKALVTGHGELLQCTREAIGLVDLTDPTAPALLFRGVALDGSVTPVGMRLLTAVPFAVAAQEAGRAERFLTVFNYEDSKAFGRGGMLASVPQQRKITLENPNTRRTTAVSQQCALAAAGVSASTTPTAATATSVPHHSVVFATGKRAGMAREESNMSNVFPHRAAVVVSSRLENIAGSNNNTTNNKSCTSSVTGSNMERGVAVQLTAPPELMASITNIEKHTEDLKSLFAQLRASRPLLDDFSKLHARVSRIAMDNQLGAPLDPDTLESIERNYQSLEGRVIVAAVERLRLSAASASLMPSTPASTRVQGSGGRRVAQSPGGGGGGSSPPLEAEKRGRMTTDAVSSSRGDEAGNISGSELPPESLLRWVAQITRSGQDEREAHRRQIESLQRHNTRIVERNAAFINGLARMEQALRTHAQRVLEADTTAVMSDASCDSLNQLHSQRCAQMLTQSLQQIEQVSVASSPKEITEAINGLITLTSRLLTSQQSVHGDDTVRRTLLDSSSARTTGDQGGDVGRQVMNNGGGVHTGRSHSPRPSAVAVVAMRPQRILNTIEDQIASVEEFVKDVGKFWYCLEETQKVIYLPYESGGRPDLFQDFMQLAVLWHLREAQVMVDVCRKESVMVMAEVLLSDIENREDTIANSPTGVVLCSGTVIMAEQNMGTGNSVTPAAASDTTVATAETVRNDSERLVGVGIELETVASRIRDSFKKAARELPKGLEREAVGGFLCIPKEKFHVDIARLRGMLYWERMTIHLLFECLECLEELVFHNDEQPRGFRKDNIKALEQQVDDWRVFLEDVHGESTQLRSVIVSSHREGGVGGGRSKSNSVSGGAGSGTGGGSGNGGDNDAGGTERSTQWVMLFGLYVQYTTRTDALPALFVSQDTNDAVSAADFGLMALHDEIAEVVEAVRAKSSALLRYCQRIQSCLTRIIEDAMVNEEAGQVLIPAWRGGPIAERYCKGFCHDMA
ncbi:hypothetical protein DQ04_09001010 [Trypanosoma grayi]|uniref:hypothetical protein n=1 Tax=Trypanosoma grayi TaxID=71804 RepID=UPI0004F46732|nr:hypothetical protein DQ04_09001010 [Trypanosoma grayi]KEG07718.1 hypothetical protein DQ04_09001010 [Trypanosoma grayi]